MSLFWYVTPSLDSTKRLAGPYDTKERCDKECIKMLSAETKMRAAYSLSMPTQFFISRPGTPSKHTTLPILQPARTHAGAPSTRTSTNNPHPAHGNVSTDTMPKLHNLALAKLKFLAQQLEIAFPENASRNELIIIIKRDLGAD